MEHKDYEAEAQRFLDKNHLILRIAFKGDKCPPWCDDRHIHGDRYRVTIKRNGKGDIPLTSSISFDFWNSHADMHQGKRPTAYDILACTSNEATMPTDPDEVVKELGEMKPSQAIAIAKFAKRLQNFFTITELGELSLIR